MRITFTVTESEPDLTQVAQALAGPVKQRFLELMGDLAFDTMRMYAPVGLTGWLRDSIQEIVSGDSVRVGPSASYGPFVELGTAPHMIFPFNAHCLAFFAGGGMVFSAYVHHPGTRPQPFISVAAQEAQSRALELWSQAFAEESA